MKYDVFNKEGKETGNILLPKEIFEVKIKHNLIHQVVTSQMSNRRQSLAHTKDRGDVRGGGKKPWRQKGLGRARHGSIRSPIWIGGGVTFGPIKLKDFKRKIPRKIRRLALFMVLSSKAKEKSIILLDELKIDKIKTKLIIDILEKFPSKKESSLIVLPDLDKNLILSSRNIFKVGTIQAKDLNCLDLLSFKYLVMPLDSVKVIEETFLKEETRETENIENIRGVEIKEKKTKEIPSFASSSVKTSADKKATAVPFEADVSQRKREGKEEKKAKKEKKVTKARKKILRHGSGKAKRKTKNKKK
jgi:large subunit ribosomal protein L4